MKDDPSDERPPTIQDLLRLALDHARAGRLSQAQSLCQQALTQQPDNPVALQLLASIAQQAGQLVQALELIQRAIALYPGIPEFHLTLGNILRDCRRPDQAAAAYVAAINLQPRMAEAHNNLGMILLEQRQFEQAIAQFRVALELKPGLANTQMGLGDALLESGQFDEAIGAYRTAAQIDPNNVRVLNNLGCALLRGHPIEEAIAALEAAAKLAPNRPDIRINLAGAYKDSGDLDQAVVEWRKAMILNPLDPRPHSELVYALHFHPKYDSAAIRLEQRSWVAQHAAKLIGAFRPHTNNRDPERRLRVGYVSPDFRAHAESCFVLPLLESHDPSQVEVHCYASIREPDSITERIQRAAAVWHDVLRLSDEALAEKIRADQIDILIDLTMHMPDNRLLVFARKPAPVQVTWLAYPGSTGMEAIDHRLTDSFLDPPAEDVSWSAEEPVRLPDFWCCWQPLGNIPEVSDLPASRGGQVTFASLNNFCKVNSAVLEMWAGVMRAVPRSRLILLVAPGQHRQRLFDSMQALGVEPNRLELHSRLPTAEYLALHHRIDIGLDTFPYNGITTTCDAMWMGVPVVTLAGNTPASRAGLGLLSTVGMPELVARTPEQYVQIAAGLAGDLPKLAQTRRSLRQRMQSSPLMNAPRFARNVEAAFRRMWRRWCGADTLS